MVDKVVTVAEYMNAMEADLARQNLEDFGIKAMVLNQNATDIWLPINLSMIAKLQVFERDAAKAQKILKEQKNTSQPDGKDDLEEQQYRKNTMADKLVTIAEYTDPMQARMAVQALADNGIKGVLMGRDAMDVYGGTLSFAVEKLQVLESRAEEAKEIIEDLKQGGEAEGLEEADDLDEPEDESQPGNEGGPEEEQ